ncbi:MAG: hypothetical protein V4641_16410 [Pseudomonadota bacterium]
MTAILRLMIPYKIDDAKLTETSIAENEYPLWDADTIYGLGVRCIKNHRIYESQVAADAPVKNKGKDPEDLTTQFGTVVFWNFINPTNRYAAFDFYRNTQTVATAQMSFVIKAGAFNMIYMDGMEGINSVDITVKDAPGGNVIYTFAGSLRGNRPSRYWEYWFNEFLTLKSKILTGIPPYSNMELSITLTGSPSGLVKLGVLGVGMVKMLGRTQQGAKAKPKNYGYVKTDVYGQNTYKEGKKALDITGSAIINKDEARQVQDILIAAMGVPCMISCSDMDTYSGLNNFGFLNGEVTYKTSITSEVSFTHEGVI